MPRRVMVLLAKEPVAFGERLGQWIGVSALFHEIQGPSLDGTLVTGFFKDVPYYDLRDSSCVL